MWKCPELFLTRTWDSVAGTAWIRFGFWGKAICGYESKKKKRKVIIWWKTLSLHLLWPGASVCLYRHNVCWFLTLSGSFVDVFLEVMMILTLSYFENQLHPSRHTNASSHAVDPFFCTVRGSFGQKMKKHNFSVKVLSAFPLVWKDGSLELWVSNKTLVYDSSLLHSNVQPLTHIKEKQA